MFLRSITLFIALLRSTYKPGHIGKKNPSILAYTSTPRFRFVWIPVWKQTPYNEIDLVQASEQAFISDDSKFKVRENLIEPKSFADLAKVAQTMQDHFHLEISHHTERG